MSLSVIDRMPKGTPIPGGIRLWHLDTNAFKDMLWARVLAGQFHLHAETDEVYAAHLISEVKERDRRGKESWVPQGRKPNHLLDCEVYAAAMADPECWGGVMVQPRPGQAAGPGKLEANQPHGWLQGRNGGWLGR
jgi:phage terminase large subunit GpA-like protein